MDDFTGKQLDQYQIIALLGRGGMATVYKAHQSGMDRHVAVKVLPRDVASDPNFMSRFRQEAKVIASLEHPHILPVYDYGDADGHTYLVMRLVERGTLADQLRGQPMPLERIRQVIAQVGDALDYAHSRGVVHRDVKPSNILVDDRGSCLLSDFGIAKQVEGQGSLTVTGSFLGTPQYASPEQGLGRDLDGRSDIYSLGVVLYEMATGRQPFDADTPMGVVVKHVHEALPPPRRVNPALPEAVERVILKALAKNRDDRYPTANALVRALDEALAAPAVARTVLEPSATVLEGSPTVLESIHQTTAPAPRVQPVSRPATAPPATPVVQGRRGAPVWIYGIGGLLGLLFVCGIVVAAGGFLPRLLANQTSGDNTAGLITAPTDTPFVSEPTALIVPTTVPPVGSNNIYVEYILDASGSMLEMLGDRSRLEIARTVLTERMQAMPPDVHVGLRVYGHRVPSEQVDASCQDIELVVPVTAGGAVAILDWLPNLEGNGRTPMSESIRQAAEDFTFTPENKNSIVLISDGMETCGDDPSDVARFLQELGIDFTIHVIGLGVDEATREQLRRLADTGRGVYHDANSEADLAEALGDVTSQAIAVPEVATAPTDTPVPAVSVDTTFEGTVEASSVWPGYPVEMSVDGDRGTSWFSTGPDSGTGTTTYRWTGRQDDLIDSITVLSNRENTDANTREHFGFGSVLIQVLDASGSVVFEQTQGLEGTPDPDVTVRPNVVGRSILLTFSSSEYHNCGGFSELIVTVLR